MHQNLQSLKFKGKIFCQCDREISIFHAQWQHWFLITPNKQVWHNFFVFVCILCCSVSCSWSHILLDRFLLLRHIRTWKYGYSGGPNYMKTHSWILFSTAHYYYYCFHLWRTLNIYLACCYLQITVTVPKFDSLVFLSNLCVYLSNLHVVYNTIITCISIL
jgi:hypothetical protein